MRFQFVSFSFLIQKYDIADFQRTTLHSVSRLSVHIVYFT